MRLLFKFLLFPIRIALCIVAGVFHFVCDCSSALLGVVSVLVFALALLTLIILREPMGALTAAIIAFLISPYGIVKLGEWFADRLDDLNYAIKSI